MARIDRHTPNVHEIHALICVHALALRARAPDAGVERGGARGERSPRGAMGVLELPKSCDVGDQAGAGEVEGETTRLAVSWSKL